MFFSYQNFVNANTLNIFTDASIRKIGKNKSAGCYGAIAMLGVNKIDEDYRICTDTTSNNSEIKAIRSGVGLAIKWRHTAQVINLFSDSQISIFGIRDRIYNWTLTKDNRLTGYGNAKIQNQSVYIEILNMIVSNNIPINFYHQKGHVKMNDEDSAENAAHVFLASNNVREKIDIYFMEYISNMNNLVDTTSRKELYKIKDINTLKKCDAFEFMPFNFKQVLSEYEKLQTNQGGYV